VRDGVASMRLCGITLTSFKSLNAKSEMARFGRKMCPTSMGLSTSNKNVRDRSSSRSSQGAECGRFTVIFVKSINYTLQRDTEENFKVIP